MFSLSFGFAAAIILIAFVAEYIDSSIGMGYGTSLTPILLVLGFKPLQIVPVVLLSELVSGVFAAVLHHAMGNVEFRIRRVAIVQIPQKIRTLGLAQVVQRGLSLHLRVVIVLASCSIVGTIAAVFFALAIPTFYLKLYIAGLIFAVGCVTLFTINKSFPFSWKKISSLGLLAAFNKGVSGGGYGPVVTSGQLLSGVNVKNAVAITSLSEGLTCLVGVILYFFTPSRVDWSLAPYLLIGAVCSVPLSVYTVKKLKIQNLRIIVGIFTVAISVFLIIKILV